MDRDTEKALNELQDMVFAAVEWFLERPLRFALLLIPAAIVGVAEVASDAFGI